MRAYLWAVSTIVATLPNQFGLAEENPRQLYVAAAEAIARSDCSRAIESLEALLELQPDSELAESAVVHLAECYLMVGQAADAFALLERHAEKGSAGRGHAKHAELQIYAARMAALKSESAAEFASALKWANRCFQLQKESRSDCSANPDDVLRIFLKDCMNRIQSGDPLEAAIENVVEDLRLPAQFALAEHLYRQQKYDQATSHFQQLKTALATTSDEPPSWASSIDLRLAEIHLHSGRYAQAEQFIETLRGSSQDPPQTAELDFLLARCAIARVEFDLAHRLLSGIIDSEQTEISDDDRAQLARAYWMRGELFFLQHKYTPAIDDYQAAIDTGDAFWTRRSYLQAAKCQELLGNVDDAAAMYQQLTRQFPDSSEADFAVQRLAKLSLIRDTSIR